MKKAQGGFTLVELLVVIVILAILAGVSVVAYGGISQRAHRSSVQSRVVQWEKAFKLYIADRGKRPQGQWACIGKAADYPAEGDFPAGACAIYRNAGATTWTTLYLVDSEGTLLSDQMQPYLSSRVVATHPVIELEGFRSEKWRGLVYDDNSSTRVLILYAVPGDSCLFPAWITYTYTNGRVCYHPFASTNDIPEWE